MLGLLALEMTSKLPASGQDGHTYSASCHGPLCLMYGNRAGNSSAELRSRTRGFTPVDRDNFGFGERYSSSGPCGFSNTCAEIM
jgi:hypothetical protein